MTSCVVAASSTAVSALVFISFLAMTGFASCVFCSGFAGVTCAGCLITRLVVLSWLGAFFLTIFIFHISPILFDSLQLTE